MRIAILHYTHAPVIGGVERVIRDQAGALRRLGHEVSLFDRSPESRLAWQQWLQQAPHGAVLVHNLFTMPFDLEWTSQLRSEVLNHPGLRWVNWVHDVAAVNPHYAHLPWQEPAYSQLSTPPARAVQVAVSEVRQRDYAHATQLPSEDVQIIPNGLDWENLLGLTERVAADIRESDWERSDVVLFHPARLIRRKNIERGIEVTARLKEQGIQALYWVSGAPDPHQVDGIRYHTELCDLARNLRVADQVRFLGESQPVDEADMRSLYAACDALFFPSTSEGFGLPLLEALCHRMPIFCSDLAVHREVLGASGHYFHPTDSPAQIAAVIQQNLPSIQVRRQFWHSHGMLKICKELLEPLILTANE